MIINANNNDNKVMIKFGGEEENEGKQGIKNSFALTMILNMANYMI